MALECGPTSLTRSPLERAFARFCVRSGLPMPLFNQTVHGYEVDCFWPNTGW